jgi:hypothetical protein
LKRSLTRLAVGLALFGLMAAAGAAISTRLAPQRLAQDIASRLSEALHTPVALGSARLEFAPWPRLVASDVQIWPGAAGAHLQIPQVTGRVGMLPLLVGRLRLNQVTLHGARLRIERKADGSWEPALFGALEPEDDAERAHPNPDELLQPLIALERAARVLLEARPALTDSLIVRDGRVAFVDRGTDVLRSDGPVRDPVALALHALNGELSHHRLRGDSQLELRARLQDRSGERGSIEWLGRRTRSDRIRIAMAATDLQLVTLEPYLRRSTPGAEVSGTLSGTLTFETQSPGHGRLELDLSLRDFYSEVPPPELGAFGPVALRRVSAGAVLAISPNVVRLESARIDGELMHLEAEGVIQRPMAPSSLARLSLAFRDVGVEETRRLLGWFPGSDQLDLAAVLEPVNDGQLVSFQARGAASLTGWQALLEGRTLTLPMGFTGEASLANVSIDIGDENRLEQVHGRLGWSGDRIILHDAGGLLNGAPLPALEVSLEGVSNLFAPAADREPVEAGGVPLLGLNPLWNFFQRPRKQDDPEEPARMRATVDVEIEALDHPMFLWPIRNLAARIQTTERGFHIVASQGRWAGVPISAEADWLFEPEETLRVRLTAKPPEASPQDPASESGDGWARGSFRVAQVDTHAWHQTRAEGRFQARDGTIVFEPVDVELSPVGKLTMRVGFDLSQPERVPFELHVDLSQGDVSTLGSQLGLEPGTATGSVEILGDLTGNLWPGRSLFADAEGRAFIDATEGTIQRRLPAVIALALVSEGFNPFARRDLIRYERVKAELEFAEGIMRSDSFALDGPDVRVMAKGGVDLANPPHEVRAEVALFLFRQLDRALDKIPLINLLLLGDDRSLLAAYYELQGPWSDPKADLIPLRTLAKGPGAVVFEGVPLMAGVPKLVAKGIRSIQSMLGKRAPAAPEPDPPEPEASAAPDPPPTARES